MLETTIAGLAAQDRQLEAVEDGLAQALAENTELTIQIRQLVQVVHDKLAAAGGPPESLADGDAAEQPEAARP